MGKQTILFTEHKKANGKMVDFAGWEMPLHYGSQLEEHQAVRTEVGMFDVSHMAVVDIIGEQSKDFLSKVLANDVNKLKAFGKALYGCICDEQGGIIDDLITYYLAENHYRVVVNAATTEKDLAWFKKQAQTFQVEITHRPDINLLAVQGPKARETLASILNGEMAEVIKNLKPFNGQSVEGCFIARTGYTGEDGVEMMIPQQEMPRYWQQLYQAGIKPCGLAARDTLRLEAGLNLYGTDMDESTSPLESNLSWTVSFEPDRDFIGQQALQQQKQTQYRRLIALVLQEKGIMRSGCKVLQDDTEIGVVTSGTFSPTLKQSIAFARVDVVPEDTCTVQIRNKTLKANVVKAPFVKKQ